MANSSNPVYPESRYYRGKAKVYIQHFEFDRIIPGIRTIDEKHIQKLKNAFETEGCLRLKPENFVDVVIDDELLQQCLADQNFNESDLRENTEPHTLELPPDAKLAVLHGKHRLLAAERYLWDKWWVARLYSTGLPEETQQVIQEEDPNARSYCDGDIYRNIRRHQQRGDVDSEIKWRGRLTAGARGELARMEKSFKRLHRGLDKLLPFLGLWKSLKLSYLGRILSLRCDEEITRYLERMHGQWRKITTGCPGDILDTSTVASLETLMPEISSHDRAQIESRMDKNELFPMVPDKRDRRRILQRILGIKGRILSFSTFFSDFIYFEACATAVKQLFPTDTKLSLSTRILHSYASNDQPSSLCQVQVAENLFEYRNGSSEIASNLGYRQLFLAVMRDFPILTGLAPYRDTRKIKPVCHGSGLERLAGLAELAFKLGFATDKIHEIKERLGVTKDKTVAHDLLQQLRPPEWYNIEGNVYDELAEHIGENITQIAALRGSRRQPRFASNLELLSKKFRCNRPSYKHYNLDREFLFIDIMYNYSTELQAYSTSLAVQRDIFISFFGDYDLPSAAEPTPGESSLRNYDETHDIGPISLDTDNSDYMCLFDASPSVADSSRPALADYIQDLQADTENESSFRTASITPRSDDLQESSATEVPWNLSEFDTATVYSVDSSIRPSDIVRKLLAHEEIILLYIWDRKEYVLFSRNLEEKSTFENFVGGLAHQDRQFVLFDRVSRVYVGNLNALWNLACRERLVLVLPKRNRSEVGHNLQSEIGRDFYGFIDQPSRSTTR